MATLVHINLSARFYCYLHLSNSTQKRYVFPYFNEEKTVYTYLAGHIKVLLLNFYRNILCMLVVRIVFQNITTPTESYLLSPEGIFLIYWSGKASFATIRETIPYFWKMQRR